MSTSSTPACCIRTPRVSQLVIATHDPELPSGPRPGLQRLAVRVLRARPDPPRRDHAGTQPGRRRRGGRGRAGDRPAGHGRVRSSVAIPTATSTCPRTTTPYGGRSPIDRRAAAHPREAGQRAAQGHLRAGRDHRRATSRVISVSCRLPVRMLQFVERRRVRPGAGPSGRAGRGRRRLGAVRQGAGRQPAPAARARGRHPRPPAAEPVIEEHFSYTYITDHFAIRNRHAIGVDRLMWSSDFPHAGSDWPESVRVIHADFADVPCRRAGPHPGRQCPTPLRLRDLTGQPRSGSRYRKTRTVAGDLEPGDHLHQDGVLLTAGDVGVAEVAAGDRPGEADLHRVDVGEVEDLHLRRVDAVQLADALGREHAGRREGPPCVSRRRRTGRASA